MNASVLEEAIRRHQTGHFADAARLYTEFLDGDPQHAHALYLFGVLHYQTGQFAHADACLSRALATDDHLPDAFYFRANARLRLGRLPDALADYENALALQATFAEAWNGRGVLLSQLNRSEEALASYERAFTLKPDYAQAFNNRGNTLLEMGRSADAVESYGRALNIKPDYRDALYNRGLALLAIGRCADALTDFEKVLAADPANAESWNNRGVALSRLNRTQDALVSYDKAVAHGGRNPHFLYNRGNALSALSRFEEASEDCARVLAIDPDFPYARGVLVHCKTQACDWAGLEDETAEISAGLAAGKRVLNPLQNIAVSRSESDQLQCARLWVRRECPPAPHLPPRALSDRKRIHIGYLSADFHAHATSYLMAGLFEAHDRTAFETSAISFGPDVRDAMNNRLRGAFEHFHDLRGQTDSEIAHLMRAREIDIAVDLKGFTFEGRPGILAHRPAPVQVNYLGFAGTMGADYIDYIVADAIVIPEGHEDFYSEKIVRLPETYQCNDSKRAIGEHTPTRAEAGLPDDGFVFCSFNANYKIMPEIFDAWMRLLHAVDGSVLWLLHSNAAAPRNLKREAQARGIAPERLIFAPAMPLEGHLARQRLADLFLDTLPYNAHTTASDALWAGLPVLTCAGTTFAGRVAASLLTAAGAPELITHSLADYEALALRLAHDSQALAALKEKLRHNRTQSPLFDTVRFCRHLEAAYRTMWERARRGLPPAAFTVARH